MRDIYAEASRVVAWIGPTADNSDLIITHLKAAGDAVAEDREADIVSEIPEDDDLARLQSAFESFCERKYWKRLWVIQEFAVGKEVYISCGGSMVTFDQLLNALDFFNKLEYSLVPSKFLRIANALRGRMQDSSLHMLNLLKVYRCPALSFMEGIMTRRRRYQEYGLTGTDSLFEVLVTNLVLEEDYNHPESTDPRDRIFSLLGLASDSKEFPTFPDYAQSCEHIYEEATRQFLRQGRIDVLSYCQFPRKPRDRTLATWAPDWFMEIKRPCMDDPWANKFSASKISSQLVAFPSLQEVTLRGVAVDRLESFGSVWDPNWIEGLDLQQACIYLTEIKYFCDQSSKISLGDEDLAIAQIAVADGVAKNVKDRDQIYLTGYHETLKALANLRRQQTVTQDLESESWFARRMKLLHSRQPFVSCTGFVGLAPWHVEYGDVICVFLGAKVPYLLRPVAGGRYNLVGEAYIYGIMYGESVSEDPPPLIESFTLI